MENILEKYSFFVNKEGVEGYIRLSNNELTIDFLVDDIEFINNCEIEHKDLKSEDKVQKKLTECIFGVVKRFVTIGCMGIYGNAGTPYKTIAIARIIPDENTINFDFSEPVFTFSINQKKLDIGDLVYGFKSFKKYLDKNLI